MLLRASAGGVDGLVDAFVRDGVGRAQLLGEVADPQFLDHPADLLDLRHVAEIVTQLLVGPGDGVDAVHPTGVAVRIAGQRVQPAHDGLQVASQVGQSLRAGGGDEAGPEQAASCAWMSATAGASTAAVSPASRVSTVCAALTICWTWPSTACTKPASSAWPRSRSAVKPSSS